MSREGKLTRKQQQVYDRLMRRIEGGAITWEELGCTDWMDALWGIYGYAYIKGAENMTADFKKLYDILTRYYYEQRG